MIYAYFECILVPEDNGKQNSNETYANKYQKRVVRNCGYKLLRVDDNFRKPFKLNLGEDDFYNFINSMVEDCSDVMKKY